MISARPKSGVDMRQGPSGPRHKPDDEGNDQKLELSFSTSHKTNSTKKDERIFC